MSETIASDKKIPIVEMFGPTIQGEGLMTGQITHFLRTGGCPLRCEWCDSMYAVDPAEVKANAMYMTTAEILAQLHELPHAPWVTFTGGDPCMHKGLGDIIGALNIAGTQVAVETQGTLFPDWLTDCDVVTFSPKPPSSENAVDPEGIIKWMSNAKPFFKGRVCIKVVVFDEEDFQYALGLFRLIPSYLYDSFYFTAGTFLEDHQANFMQEWVARTLDVCLSTTQLADRVIKAATSEGIEFNEKVAIGNQQHVLLWPQIDRGV